MPYFVFKVTVHPESGAKLLDYLATHADYRSAKQFVKAEREKISAANQDVRMVFAKNQSEAEKLLSIPRDDRVIGEW